MFFSRCSSAGLHGVLVLLFLATGPATVVSAGAPLCASAPSGSPPAAEDVEASAIVLVPGAFRFLEVGGELEGGSGLEVSSMPAETDVSEKCVADDGWRRSSGAVVAGGGLGFRLDVGGELQT